MATISIRIINDDILHNNIIIYFNNTIDDITTSKLNSILSRAYWIYTNLDDYNRKELIPSSTSLSLIFKKKLYKYFVI